MKLVSPKRLAKIRERQVLAADTTSPTLEGWTKAVNELIHNDVSDLCDTVKVLMYGTEQLKGRIIILETIIEAIIASEDTIGSTFDAKRWQHELDMLRPAALSVAPS